MWNLSGVLSLPRILRIAVTPTTSGFLIKCNSGYVSIGECVGAASSGYLGTALLRGKYYVASL